MAIEERSTLPMDHQSRQYRMGPKELLVMVSAIMAFTALGIDLMLPAFDEIRADFDLGADSTETSRVITVYLLGLAIGQLFYGPLADRYGRKKTLYAGASIYVIGAVAAALAPTFGLLLAGRFVSGIGAAGARVVATSIVRDRFEGVAMARAMSNVMAVFLLVPVVAPSIGALIVATVPWRGVFWFCAAFAAAVVVWSLRLRETLDPANRRELNVKNIAGGYRQVARTPVTFGYTIAGLFIQGAFTTYLASSELIIANVFDREEQFPVIFGGVAILFGLASMINGRIVGRLGIDRVVSMAYGNLGITLSVLIVLSFVGGDSPNFWLFMPVLGLTLSSFMFILTNLNAAGMAPLGAIAGSGSALTGSVRAGGGAVLGGIFSEQVDDSVWPLVLSVTGLVVCSAVSVWLVRRGGIRAVISGDSPRRPALEPGGS